MEEIYDEYDPLLIVGREFHLENAGSIDLLAVDVSGLLTIIEFKLERNTDIRKVVAQVVEYAANMWEMSYDLLDKKVKEYFSSKRCAQTDFKKLTLAQAAEWHFQKNNQDNGADFSLEDFIKNVSSNLQKGEFRLIIFCDKVDERTKRTVEYINANASFEIYCVSTDLYEIDDHRYFKSSLITKTAQKRRQAGKIIYNDFLNSFSNENSGIKGIYEHLENLMREVGGDFSMGTKGFAAYLPIGDKRLRIFSGFPDHIELISKKYFDGYVNIDEVVVSKDQMQDYAEGLTNIAPFNKSFEDKRVYPTIKYDKMKAGDLNRFFNFIFEWYKKCFVKEE